MYTFKHAYTDYNGIERIETYRFALNETEITQLELSTDGLFSNKLQKFLDKKDIPELMAFYKDFILAAYGEVSDDGRYFKKSKELSEQFTWTPAYNELFMKISHDADLAFDFIKQVVPKKLNEEIEKRKAQLLEDNKARIDGPIAEA